MLSLGQTIQQPKAEAFVEEEEEEEEEEDEEEKEHLILHTIGSR